MVTRPESPLNSLADLLALAKKEGDKVSFASFGNGTSNHLAGEAFRAAAGITLAGT